MPIVRPFEASEWPLYKTLRLRALVESPDAFGSTFAVEALRTDEQWAERLTIASTSGQDLPLIALSNGEPAGLTWAKVEAANPTNVNLFQMWVAPEHRGQGIGRMLLDAAIHWARQRSSAWLSLGVTCADTPALHLYRNAGFVIVGAPEPLRDGAELQVQNMRLALAPG